MTIELSCPHCQKLLRTTDDKAGQTAKCPGCGELITIPEPPELYEPVAEEEQVTIADEEGDVDDGADRKPCPLCGGMIRRTARKCRFCGEQIGTAPAQFERDDKSKSLELGDVIQASWERYKEHMGLAVGCLFLAVIIQYIPFIGVMVAANVLDHGGPELQPIAAVAFVSLLLLGIGVMLFLSCGVVRVMLKIAKDDDPRFADLFSIHLPTIGSLFVANLISTVCIAVGMFFCIVPGIYLSLLWMPLPFVIIDQKLGPIAALAECKRLTDGNLLHVFLLTLIGNLIGSAGYLACGAGLLFSIPFMVVMYTMVYLRLKARAGEVPVTAVAEA